jgi:hypothetical protein
VRRIQAVARGARVRLVAQQARAEQRHESAILIQRKTRWMMDREFVRVLRLLLREKAKEDRAVTKLQSNFRALKGRRATQETRQHVAATKVQRGLSQRGGLFGRVSRKRSQQGGAPIAAIVQEGGA